MTNVHHGGGIPIDEYSRQVPPGWAPGIAGYTMKLYQQKVRLWYHMTDLPETAIGSALAGRLKGGAFRLAMKLRCTQQDGTVVTGDVALASPALPAYVDPNTGREYPETKSGVQHLLMSLDHAYGSHEQDMQTTSLDDFFGHVRGHSALMDYLTGFRLRYEEAEEMCGLQINAVGLSHLLLKHSGLPERLLDDIRLKVNGNLENFTEILGLLRRMAKSETHNKNPEPGRGQAFYEEGYGDDGCNPRVALPHHQYLCDGDGRWYLQDPDGYEIYLEIDYDDEDWWGVDVLYEHWDGTDGEIFYEGMYPDAYQTTEELYDQDWNAAGHASPSHDTFDTYQFRKGKGKGKKGKGKGKGKFSGKFGKGKGKGKNKGKPRNLLDPPASSASSSSGPAGGKGCSKCGSKWHRVDDCPVAKLEQRHGGQRGGDGRRVHFNEQPSSTSGTTAHMGFLTEAFVNDDGYTQVAPLLRRDPPIEPDPVIQDRIRTLLAQPEPQQRKTTGVTSSLELFNTTDDTTRVNPLTRSDHGSDSWVAKPQRTEETTTSGRPRAFLTSITTEMYNSNNSNMNHFSSTLCTQVWNNKNNVDNFYMVGGTLRRGYLIDDGAADGLVGSETLRDYLDNVPQPKGCSASIVASDKKFSGISGGPNNALGQAIIPAMLGDLKVDFKSHVIGGAGSDCPFLVPNSSLIKHSAVTLHGLYDNGDGALCLVGSDQTKALRLLLTDSGHYLLPTDRPLEAVQEQQAVNAVVSDALRQLARTLDELPSVTEHVPPRDPLDSRERDQSCTKAMHSYVPHNSCTCHDSCTKAMHSYAPHNSCTCHDSYTTTSGRRATTNATTATTIHSAIPPTIDDNKNDNVYNNKNNNDSINQVLLSDGRDLPNGAGDRATAARAFTIHADVTAANDESGSSPWVAPLTSSAPAVRCAGQHPATTTTLTASRRSTAKPSTVGGIQRQWCQDYYTKDELPTHWSAEQQTDMAKRYKCMPEEFYRKTNLPVLRPQNAHLFMEAHSGHNYRPQFWERCSGSGRLSLKLVRAELTVLPPIDARYGWDLKLPAHQRLLTELQEWASPAVTHDAPECRNWSVLSNQRNPVELASARRGDHDYLQYLHERHVWQSAHNLGYIIENPWGSAMWTQSPMAQTTLLPGNRTHREDQCMHGRKTDDGEPIKHSSRFDANFPLRSLRRCTGHGLQNHAVLQGRDKGAPGPRATMAAVYMPGLCHALLTDIRRYLKRPATTDTSPGAPHTTNNATTTLMAGSSAESILWSCPACRHGANTGDGHEHTMDPTGCKIARRQRAREARVPAPAQADDSAPASTANDESGSSPWAAPPTASAPAVPVAAPPLQPTSGSGGGNSAADRSTDALIPSTEAPDALIPSSQRRYPVDPQRISAAYRRLQTVKVSDVTLRLPDYLRNLDSVWLRRCLIDLVGKHHHFYDHKDEDNPARADLIQGKTTDGTTQLLIEILSPYLTVLSAHIIYKPLLLQPDSALAIVDAPLRLAFVAKDIQTWASLELDNLADMSPFDHVKDVNPSIIEWLLVLQGTTPLPTSTAVQQILPRLKLQVIRPDFDFSKLARRLHEGDDQERAGLLRGVHERFWHATKTQMHRMLGVLQVPDRVHTLIDEVVESCASCGKFVLPPTRPRVGAELAGWFNDRLFIDLFFLWDMTFLLAICAATRYKIAIQLNSKSGPEILRALLHHWIKYFGPPKMLISDQEGGLTSDLTSTTCERYGIQRVLAGSAVKGVHTMTGLPERHVSLIKRTALATWDTVARQGLTDISKEDVVAESAMVQNALLEYGGYSPAQCVLGSNPRGLFEFEADGVTSYDGSIDTSPDVFEQHLRLRLIAREHTMKAVVEDRIAQANRARPQKVDISVLRPGRDLVDIYREPEKKSDSGWRGPAELLDISTNNNTAIVKLNSMPFIVPLRHVRPHMAAGFLVTINTLLNFHNNNDDDNDYHPDNYIPKTSMPTTTSPQPADDQKLLLKLLEYIDGCAPGALITHGTVLNDDGITTYLPENLLTDPPAVYQLVTDLAGRMFNFPDVVLIRFGTAIKRALSVNGFQRITYIVWNRNDRSKYLTRDTQQGEHPAITRLCEHIGGWSSCSLLILHGHTVTEDRNPSPMRWPDLSDLSSIHDVPDTHMDDGDFWWPEQLGPHHDPDDDPMFDAPLAPELDAPMPASSSTTTTSGSDPWVAPMIVTKPNKDDTSQRTTSPPPDPPNSGGASSSTGPVLPLAEPDQPSEHGHDETLNPTELSSLPPLETPSPQSTLPYDISTSQGETSTITCESDLPINYETALTNDLHDSVFYQDADMATVRAQLGDLLHSPLADDLVKEFFEQNPDAIRPAPRSKTTTATANQNLIARTATTTVPDLTIQAPTTTTTTSLPYWTREEADYVFKGPWDHDTCFYIDLVTLETFKVDEDTNNLTEADIVSNWAAVERADRKELQQFVNEKVWRSMHETQTSSRPIDAIWIRKWKRLSDGTYEIKSRLCARGFLDAQAAMIPTRSTTASRLSQRLLVSLSVLLGYPLESWDVSGAFLKGFPFREVEQHMRARGIKTPKRQVTLKPPKNVWRHLRDIKGSGVHVSDALSDTFLLELLKPMYGLNDAPLAWQVCLSMFYVEVLQACQSAFDECFYFWMSGPGVPAALATSHVDDNGVAAPPSWLGWAFARFTEQFGNCSRTTLPLTHTGVRYSVTAHGSMKLDQDEFCQKLKPAPIAAHRKDTDTLLPHELTDFRSILGGLLWLCQTRLDLVCDVVLRMSSITGATVAHLKAANSLVTKAKKYAAGVGLHFPRLRPPLSIRCVPDASHATKETSYAQEGVLVLLGEEVTHGSRTRTDTHEVLDPTPLGGFCHILGSLSHKAKRVSFSTSHAETLAAIAGKELSQLIAIRLAECFSPGCQWPLREKVTLNMLIHLQETAAWPIPIDHFTDCRDLYELMTGERGIPQDRHQRLYVAALREDRTTGAIRHVYKIPTQWMCSDALTKAMLSVVLYELLTTGYWFLNNTTTQKVTCAPRISTTTEIITHTDRGSNPWVAMTQHYYFDLEHGKEDDHTTVIHWHVQKK